MISFVYTNDSNSSVTVSLTRAFAIDGFKFERESKTTVRENEFGKKDCIYRPPLRILVGEFRLCNKTEQKKLDDLFVACGVHRKVAVTIDQANTIFSDGSTKLNFTGYFEDYPEWDMTAVGLYNTSVRIKEGT